MINGPRQFHQVLLVATVALLLRSANADGADRVFDARGFDPHRPFFSQLPFEHIDPLTGNLLLTFTDLVLPGNAGFDVKIQRTYNSKIYKDYQNLGETLAEDSGTSQAIRALRGDNRTARELFDALRQGAEVVEAKPGVLVSKTGEGEFVTFRPQSKSGGPSVEFNPRAKGREPVKIHFADK
jgi:Domain of unknown function (DUF6531)